MLDSTGPQESLLRALARREVSLVEVETPTASPFASSLLFDYVATYMYEGDAPNAERRAAALSLDRELLRELLGQEELRELIDAGALEQLEADLAAPLACAPRDLARRAARPPADARRSDGRRRSATACSPSSTPRRCSPSWFASAARSRCGSAREQRYIAAQDAGLYRDALGVMPPSGLPDAFLEDVPDALRALAVRHARTHGPFTTAELGARYGVDVASVLRELEAAGTLVRGELRPLSHPLARAGEREWCDPDVLRRLRRASLAVLRREIEPAERRALATFLPSWQGIDRHAAAGAGDRAPARDARAAAGPRAAGGAVGAQRAAAAHRRLLDELARPALRGGRGRLGRRRRRSAAARAASRSTSATTRRRSARRPPPRSSSAPAEPEHELIRERLRAAPCFFADLLADLDAPVEALQEALWDLVWAGEVTNDAWAPLRAPRLALARQAAPARAPDAASRPRCAPRAATRARPCRAAGRWRPPLRAGPRPGRAAAHDRRAAARALRHPHARARPGGGRPRRLRRALRLARRARDDRRLPPRLLHRGPRRRPVRAAGSGRAAARAPRGRRGAAARARRRDPAQPYGAALPWPSAPAPAEGRRAARVAGAYVVLVGAEPAVLRRGRRAAASYVHDRRAAADRAGRARRRRARRPVRALELERVDGEPALGSRSSRCSSSSASAPDRGALSA